VVERGTEMDERATDYILREASEGAFSDEKLAAAAPDSS
jgi:hypothetical protein